MFDWNSNFLNFKIYIEILFFRKILKNKIYIYIIYRKMINSNSEPEIDYNTEYITYKRCYKCQRVTNGIEDYQSISKKNKIRMCKTCNKCRSSVKSSLLKYREPTLKEKYEIIKKFLFLSSSDNINEILEKFDDNEKPIILKILS